MRRRVYFGAVGVLLVTLVVVRAATYAAPIDWYTRSADKHELTVYARTGTGDGVLWEWVRDDDGRVQVVVWAHRNLTAAINDLVASHVAITVRLDTPLGTRTVTDGDGRVVPEQK